MHWNRIRNGLHIIVLPLVICSGCSTGDGINSPMRTRGVSIQCLSAERFDEPPVGDTRCTIAGVLVDWDTMELPQANGQTLKGRREVAEKLDVFIVSARLSETDLEGWDIKLVKGDTEKEPIAPFLANFGSFDKANFVFLIQDDDVGPFTLCLPGDRKIVLDSILQNK